VFRDIAGLRLIPEPTRVDGRHARVPVAGPRCDAFVGRV